LALSLTKWRPWHLLGAWGAYWLGLATVTLGPAILAIARVTAPNAHGSMTASMADGTLKLEVMENGATAWSGSASLWSIVAWIAVPPLLLWLLWNLQRPRVSTDHSLADVRPDLSAEATGRHELGEPSPDFVVAPRDKSAGRNDPGGIA